MKLYVSEPSERHTGPILVCDEDGHNDIAEFFHNEHATVSQSYETALGLAQALVEASAPVIATEAQMRELYCDEDDDPTEPMQEIVTTHDGDWRREGYYWRFHEYPDPPAVQTVSAVPTASLGSKDGVSR